MLMIELAQLMAIGQCVNIPTTDLYRETNTNTSFPYTTKATDVDGDGTVDTETAADTKGSSSSTDGAMALQSSSFFCLVAVAAAFSLML